MYIGLYWVPSLGSPGYSNSALKPSNIPTEGACTVLSHLGFVRVDINFFPVIPNVHITKKQGNLMGKGACRLKADPSHLV